MNKNYAKSRLYVQLIFSAILIATCCRVAAAQQQPDSVAGNWTIYANNVEKAGSSLKIVQLSQNGNIVTGHFKGSHQSGKLQGWVNGHHIEFSTDTRDVLTFRGQIDGDQMSGLYGVHGRHAEWHAEKSN